MAKKIDLPHLLTTALIVLALAAVIRAVAPSVPVVGPTVARFV